MGRLSNIFKRKILRPESRDYVGILCPSCRSPKVIKDTRECGRIARCDNLSCAGCRDYQTSNSFNQRFRCLDCKNQWSIISSL